MEDLARQELRELLLARFPVLAQWEASLADRDPSCTPRTPDEVYTARGELAKRVLDELDDYIGAHEDDLRERAVHLLTLEHVASRLEQAEESRKASEARYARHLCPACGLSDAAIGEPGRWSLLTGEPATRMMRHPIVGPCCLKCAQLARFDYLLVLQAEPIAGRGGDSDLLESRAMIARQLRIETVGD